jgi:hypothetical protein
MSSISQATQFEQCFSEILNESQHCSNKDVYYWKVAFRPLGNNGFGSQWNAYLVPGLIDAVLRKKRLVLFNDNSPWEYDCAEKKLWGCYFTFPCEDSILLTDSKNVSHSTREAARTYSSVLDYIQRSKGEPSLKNRKMSEIFDQPSCRTANIFASDPDPLHTMITSSVAYLWNVNSNTTQRVQELNKDIYRQFPLVSNRFTYRNYISLYLRLTDKVTERNEKVKQFLQYQPNVIDYIVPFASTYGVYTLLITSDDCSYVSDLFALNRANQQAGNSSLRMLSPCFATMHNESSGINSERVAQRRSGRGGPHHANGLIADIELAADSYLFIGIFDSNISRLIARLRVAHKPAHLSVPLPALEKQGNGAVWMTSVW